MKTITVSLKLTDFQVLEPQRSLSGVFFWRTGGVLTGDEDPTLRGVLQSETQALVARMEDSVEIDSFN